MNDRYDDDRFDEDEPSAHEADRFDADDRMINAQELFQQAYELQMDKQYEQAISLYKQSIEVYATAEAHTFLGWTYSFQERLDEAIAECHRAIEVDPDFGNPYNDIGVYLMQKGRFDEALSWLEKAKQAPRYEPRHFPYLNSGRIYWARGEWLKALKEFEQAVEIMPDDPGARQALAELRGRLN
jgi:Tfp pilus assembly protein PilF